MPVFFKRLWQSGKRKDFEKAMELYNQRRYGDAVEAFEEILGQESASSDVYYNLSSVYCSQSYHYIGFRDFLLGLFPQACNYFQKALDLQPGHIDLYQLIGICRNNMRDHEGAAEAFQFLLTIDHNRSAARINQGIVFNNLQLWDKAAQHHAEIIRVPRNLAVPVPDGVGGEAAATVTLGAIALQGVRRAQPTLGETFIVIGLGLLGQLTQQFSLAGRLHRVQDSH